MLKLETAKIKEGLPDELVRASDPLSARKAESVATGATAPLCLARSSFLKEDTRLADWFTQLIYLEPALTCDILTTATSRGKRSRQ